MKHSDPRLKYLLTYYSKKSDDIAGEFEIVPPPEAELRRLLNVSDADPLVDVYPVPPEAVASLSRTCGCEPDIDQYDYFYQVVVRTEYIVTYGESAAPPYPAPEVLLAFPDAVRVRSKTDADA